MAGARVSPVAPSGTSGISRSLSLPLLPFTFILYLCTLEEVPIDIFYFRCLVVSRSVKCLS